MTSSFESWKAEAIRAHDEIIILRKELEQARVDTLKVDRLLALRLVERARDELASIRSALDAALAGETAASDVSDHKWLDPECGANGCQSLVWKSRYESAVRGRREFRQAYREHRDAALAADGEFTPIAVSGSTKPKSPPAPSDAELVERLKTQAKRLKINADMHAVCAQTMDDAAAAIERLTRLCAAYEGTIKADERELDNADETIERFEKALAAEREALADERRGHKTTAEALFDMKARAEAAETERDKATEERNDIFYYWSRPVGEAQERVKELEAKASSPKL